MALKIINFTTLWMQQKKKDFVHLKQQKFHLYNNLNNFISISFNDFFITKKCCSFLFVVSYSFEILVFKAKKLRDFCEVKCLFWETVVFLLFKFISNLVKLMRHNSVVVCNLSGRVLFLSKVFSIIFKYISHATSDRNLNLNLLGVFFNLTMQHSL